MGKTLKKGIKNGVKDEENEKTIHKRTTIKEIKRRTKT
jgi:hypothetical protein